MGYDRSYLVAVQLALSNGGERLIDHLSPTVTGVIDVGEEVECAGGGTGEDEYRVDETVVLERWWPVAIEHELALKVQF